MRVAAIYDIHGNLPALEAVLEEIRQLRVDQVVVGGDLFPGPMPLETLTYLQEVDMPVQFIYGNGDIAVLEQMAGRNPSAVREEHWRVIRWTAEQLNSNHQRMLASWPKTIRLEIPGLGAVLFCHATPRNENEIFTRLTPADRLAPVFEESGAAVVVCGHTHMQFDRMVGDVRVVNAGSVGMPFGRSGADWLLLGPEVQLKHTDYNLMKAADRIRESGSPQAREFAASNVLQTPSESKMLELFTGSELK